MVPREKYEEAIRRIERAKAEDRDWLDLGDLLLENLPPELGQLTHLKTLALGSHAIHAAGESIAWDYESDRPYQSFADLRPLASLSQLEHLDLMGCQNVRDLEPLVGLPSLVHLDLRHTSIEDLGPLRRMPQLRSLSLIECVHVQNLNELAHLPNLATLLVNVTRISDLSPLAGLTHLRQLYAAFSRVEDLAPIQNLPSLERLNCSGTSISDLSPLSGLTRLCHLHLRWCREITSLEPLAGLKRLRELNLEGCSGLTRFEPIRGLVPTLETLVLDLCPFEDLPPELCENNHENALSLVRAHFADLEQGAEVDTELKLMVLGNGGVGKTQLCRRLRGEPFDPSIPSTHGVQLGGFPLRVREGSAPFQVRYWDFGGQDIYHGTHALFLNRQAVFLILWHPEHEDGTTIEQGVAMRNRPLAYWLDYIRGLAGTDCPVLVVQAQCDEPGLRVKPPSVPVDDFRYLRFLEISARTDLGLEVLFAQIKESIRALLAARPPQSIGLGRRMVRDRLREMLQSGTTRVLDRSEFAALCAATGKVSNPDALLGFLHHAGVVFHRPDLFEDRIILDQTWALDAIYTLFHRQDTLPYLFRDGRFTRELLGQLAWKDKPLADQVVLLGMMESCGICFRAGSLAGDHEAPVWEYVAPDLLPEWSTARARLLGRLHEGEPDDQVTVRFTFLHEGILRAFLSRVGRQAGEAAVYWKYGCWFAEERANATILVQGRMGLDRAYPGKGEITLQSWGAGASGLLDQVLRLVLEIRVGQPPEVIRRAEVLKPSELDALSDSKGGDELRAVRRDQMPDDGKRRVHLSYAWGDTTPQGRLREDLVDRLCDRLREWGYDVLRDKDVLRSGEAISVFMRSIGQSERILVVLSEKYLRSVYCMTELHEIYRNSRGEKDDFLRRIIPLTLDDARIGSAADRGRHALYWKRQREELQPLVAEGVLGETDLAQWCRMARWVADVSEMLAHINDTLHAVGFDAILADDFAGVRERLQRRE